MTKNEVLVFIPTYNELQNVEILYKEIKKNKPEVDILFCDDNSPDGTGVFLDELAKKDPTVFVMHREKKLGLGTAHLCAFDYAQKHSYRYLITMDADLTHDPKYIPALFDKKDNSDVVIGSRYIDGGSMSGWGKVRLKFTYFWRNLIKNGLGMPYDCTGAYRLYHVKVLNRSVYEKVKSKGFSFCIESLFRLKEAGCKVAEVPIKARNRIHGESKLSFAIMKEAAFTFCRLFFERKSSKK